MKENLDLNQILFDELVEFPRKRLGISIREFCAKANRAACSGREGLL